MTQEEKAKAYDKALSVALETYKTQPMYKDWLEKMFPELAESEDEKIRKTLINGFNKLDKSAVWYNGITNAQILDWLEKQANHANFRNKIQIGDKVTRNRDGVLVNLSQLNRVAKKDEKQGEQKPSWSEEDEAKLKSILFHIEDVENKDVIDWLKSLKDRVQPKQEWSEEYENFMYDTISNLTELKDRYGAGYGNVGKCIDWLKSLRPQSQWKPSKEQLYYLYWIANIKMGDSVVEQDVSKHLNELYEQLKQL